MPGSPDASLSIKKEKADSGVAWAQAEMGRSYLFGSNGVPKDVEKAKSLLREAAEKGDSAAKESLGFQYLHDANYEEARRWFEAAAAGGRMRSLCRLGMMMKKGQVFDQNEQTRAEAFRLITISATLYRGTFKLAAMELAYFFRDSLPVMLHYLRPAVEEGKNTSAGVTGNYALGLIREANEYYGKKGSLAPGYNPVPEALFWYRRCSGKEETAADHPLVRFEREVRKNCAHCQMDLPEDKPSCCVECRAAYYCSRDCQVAHWRAGHKKDCVKKLKQRLGAEGKLEGEK